MAINLQKTLDNLRKKQGTYQPSAGKGDKIDLNKTLENIRAKSAAELEQRQAQMASDKLKARKMATSPLSARAAETLAGLQEGTVQPKLHPTGGPLKVSQDTLRDLGLVNENGFVLGGVDPADLGLGAEDMAALLKVPQSKPQEVKRWEPAAEKDKIEFKDYFGYLVGEFGAGMLSSPSGILGGATTAIGDLATGGQASAGAQTLANYFAQKPQMLQRWMTNEIGVEQMIKAETGVSDAALAAYRTANTDNWLSQSLQEDRGHNLEQGFKDVAGDIAYTLGQQAPGFVYSMGAPAADGGGILSSVASAIKNKSGVGQALASSAKGALKGNVNTWLMGTGAAGNQLTELAKQKGYDPVNYINAMGNGFVEYINEGLLGFSDGDSIKALWRATGSKTGNTLRSVARWLMTSVEEGLEEVINVPMSGIVDKMTVDPDKKLVGEGGIFDLKEMLRAGIMGATVGLIMGGVGGVSSIRNAVLEGASIFDAATATNHLIDTMPKDMRPAHIDPKTATAETLEQKQAEVLDALEHMVDAATVNAFEQGAEQPVQSDAQAAPQMQTETVQENEQAQLEAEDIMETSVQTQEEIPEEGVEADGYPTEWYFGDEPDSYMDIIENDPAYVELQNEARAGNIATEEVYENNLLAVVKNNPEARKAFETEVIAPAQQLVAEIEERGAKTLDEAVQLRNARETLENWNSTLTDAELDPNPLARQNMEVYDGGQDPDTAGSERRSGARTGEQTAGVERSAGKPASVKQSGVARQRRARLSNFGAQKVNLRSVGVEENAEATIYPEETWDAGMRNTYNRMKELGHEVVFVSGVVSVRGERANGLNDMRGHIVVQADSNMYTVDQIADHEAFHSELQDRPGLRDDLMERIAAKFSEEELDRIVARYFESYRGVANFSENMSEDEWQDMLKYVWDEILCDAWAEKNSFGYGATKFTETVHTGYTEKVHGRDAAANVDVRGPPIVDGNTFSNPTTGENVRYSLREEAPPKKTIIAYKAFYAHDGKLYPPMVSNQAEESTKITGKVAKELSGTLRGQETPVGVWLNADVGGISTDKDGNVVRTKDTKRIRVENDKGGGTLAFRPGWHLGEWPDAKQFNRGPLVPYTNAAGEQSSRRMLMPDGIVFAKCEIAADVDYQVEAMEYAVTETEKKGKTVRGFSRSQAGLPRVPEDGYYKYRTNVDPTTAPWYITGAMRVVEILDDDDCARICAEYGVTPDRRESGKKINLADYGLKRGPVTPTENLERFKKNQRNYDNEALLERALSDPEYADAYTRRPLDFDDPQVRREFEMNGQNADDYRTQYSLEDGEGRETRGYPMYSADADVRVNAQQEVRFSLAKDDEFMSAAEKKNNGLVDEKVMEKARKDRKTIADIFNDPELQDSLGLPPDIIGNTYIPNDSYSGTEENTTVCIRSIAADALMDAVAEKLERPLTVEDTVAISQQVMNFTDKPECLYCYVAMDRKAHREFLGSYLQQRDEILEEYRSGDWDTNTYTKAQIDRMSEEEKAQSLYVKFLDGRKPTKPMANRFAMWLQNDGKEVITAKDLASPANMERAADRNPKLKAQINDALKYAQSASWAKKRLSYAAYNNHILKWKADRIRNLNSNYGLRMYSFSDFSPAFILENMQMFTDAAVRGLKVLAYTKELDFVRIFAKTGANINISVFGYDDGAGGVAMDAMQGADWAEAQELRRKHKNVGCTFVATNDAQVEWAMEQDWIDVVIPFHLVRTGAEVANYFNWTNYTQMSSDVKTKAWQPGNAKHILPPEHQNNKKKYLAACKANNLTPRFEKWVDNPNYMKLVNETRQSEAATEPVQPVFDIRAAKASIEEMRKRGGYYTPIGGSVEEMYGIAEEIAENIRDGKTGVRFSVSEEMDSEYMDAVSDEVDSEENVEPAVEQEKQQKIQDAATARKELRTDLLDLFSVPQGKRKEAGERINEYAKQILERGRLKESDRTMLFDILHNYGEMVVPASQYQKALRGAVKGGKVYVPENVKAEFGDRDSWNEFNRRAFAAGVYFTSNPEDSHIDVWNSELAVMFPGAFDEYETDERRVLLNIVHVAEEGKAERMTLAEYATALSEEYGPGVIVDYYDNMERQMDRILDSFADKARFETKLRKRTTAQIERDRAWHQQRREKQRETKHLKEQQQKTLRQLQWLSKNRHKAPADLRKRFDEVLADLDVYAVSAANEMNYSKKYDATWRDLADMYLEAKQNDPNWLPSKDLERIVSRLKDPKLEDFNFNELNDLYRAALGLRQELYNRRNMLIDERMFEEVYADSVKDIKQSKAGYKGTKGDHLMNLQQLTPMNVIERMAGWNPDSAWLSMGKQLEQGERDTKRFVIQSNKMLQEFIEKHEDWVSKADGQGKDAIWYEFTLPELTGFRRGDAPIFSDNNITIHMTPMMRVQLYMESKSYDNLNHMLGGRRFADKEMYTKAAGDSQKRREAMAKGQIVRLTPEMVRSLCKDMTAEELELAHILGDMYYNEFSKKEINRVSNVLYGYDKAMSSWYTPIYTDQSFNKSEPGIYDATAEGAGNLKERIRMSTNPSLNLSALDAFERSVSLTSKFVGMAIPVRNWNTLMNWRTKDDSMKNVIRKQWGEEMQSYLDDVVVRLQNPDVVERTVFDDLVGGAMSNYISAVFGLNPSVVAKQFGSYFMALPYLGRENMPTPKQIHNADPKIIAKYSPELDDRLMGYAIPEVAQLKQKPNWSQKNKVVQFVAGGGAITAMDGWTAKTLWPWAENKVARETELKRGTDEFYKRVAEEFDKAIVRSQSINDVMHRSQLMNSKNAVTRAFTMFKSDTAQSYNALREAFGEAQYMKQHGDEEQKKAANKKAAYAVMGVAANNLWAAAINLLVALWKNKGKNYRDDEGELTAASVGAQFAEDTLTSMAGTVIGGQEVADVLASIIGGDKWYGIELPGGEQLNDMVDEIKAAGDGIKEILMDSYYIVGNDGNLAEYLEDRAPDLIGAAKQMAQKIVKYIAGAPVDNLEAYLVGTLRWAIPKAVTAYEDALKSPANAGLKGLKGGALEARMDNILRDRMGGATDETVKELSRLYGAVETSIVPPEDTNTIGDLTLTADQKQVYRMSVSQTVGRYLDEFVASERYAEMDDEAKAKRLNTLYKYAKEIAKAAVTGAEPEANVQKINDLLDGGMEISEALTAYDEYERSTKLLEAGLDPELTADLAVGIRQAEDANGKDVDLSNLEKYELVLDYIGDEAMRYASLAGMMDEKELARFTSGHEWVSSETYIKFLRAFKDMYPEENKSQERVEIVLKSMDLDRSERAALWQMSGKNWKAENNPFDWRIGEEIFSAIEAAYKEIDGE